ncbi:hypothetical protein KY284_019450 [Solanum tuberosum]|nr:hypothetical protein KY284_019450 [Solanum tuberosum]
MDAQYECMCISTELTSCTLPTYERCLDPHVQTLPVIFSTNTSQSPVESLFAETGTPKYLNASEKDFNPLSIIITAWYSPLLKISISSAKHK